MAAASFELTARERGSKDDSLQVLLKSLLLVQGTSSKISVQPEPGEFVRPPPPGELLPGCFGSPPRKRSVKQSWERGKGAEGQGCGAGSARQDFWGGLFRFREAGCRWFPAHRASCLMVLMEAYKMLWGCPPAMSRTWQRLLNRSFILMEKRGKERCVGA